MTSATKEIEKPNAIADLIASAPKSGPDWLNQLRSAGAQKFAQLGLPTTRHEDWRFTNIRPIRESSFVTPNGQGGISSESVKRFTFPDLPSTNLVFVNGRFDAALSHVSPTEKGIQLISLATAIESDHKIVREHLGQYATIENEVFTAANTAMIDEGVFLHIDKNTSVEQPIHIINVTVASGEPVMTHPRCLIVAETGSAATIIEDYVSINEKVYFTNAVTEIFVGENADITHYMLERESRQAFNISSLYVRQLRDSRFSSHSVLLGGAITRNNVAPVLDGENCYSLLNGVYVINGEQIADNHMRVTHAKPHCDSRQYYKGIMNEKAKGVFRGRIIVAQNAQLTDAKQSNQNLLLSDDASANADPQLEIYADDVKCTHGATVGQLDKDQIFYLQARGIPLVKARAMIINAFAAENLERMNLKPVADYLKQQLYARLSGTES